MVKKCLEGMRPEPLFEEVWYLLHAVVPIYIILLFYAHVCRITHKSLLLVHINACMYIVQCVYVCLCTCICVCLCVFVCTYVSVCACMPQLTHSLIFNSLAFAFFSSLLSFFLFHM